MSSDTRSKISQMLYHLGNGNRASADRELAQIVKIKMKNVFEKEYQKVKDQFSKEIK